MSKARLNPSFLNLPPEIRNRIYTFATYPTTGERCCVSPCMGLVLTCKQIFHEYRPICIKADVTIDWRDVPQYFKKYFTNKDGTFANIELAPARMTIVTNVSLKGNRPVEIDLLPLLKFRLANKNFVCEFIRSGDGEGKGCACVQNGAEVSREDLKTLLAADVKTVQKLLTHQQKDWIEDITNERVRKIMVSHIGSNCCPQARFFLGPGSHNSAPPEFADLVKDKEKARMAETSGTRQATSPHWILTLSRNFNDYMDRIKLQSAFTDNQYSFVLEFKWSSTKVIPRNRVKGSAVACGPGEDSDSGVSVN